MEKKMEITIWSLGFRDGGATPIMETKWNRISNMKWKLWLSSGLCGLIRVPQN